MQTRIEENLFNQIKIKLKYKINHKLVCNPDGVPQGGKPVVMNLADQVIRDLARLTCETDPSYLATRSKLGPKRAASSCDTGVTSAEET